MPESLAAQLAYLLDDFCLSCIHQNNINSEVRSYMQELSFTANLGFGDVTSIADGGIAQYTHTLRNWVMTNPCVAKFPPHMLISIKHK